MAAPVIAGTAANSGGSGTTATVNLPSGISSGDLILLLVANENNSNTVQFADDVTGYNLELTIGNSSVDAHAALYSRVADGTESGSVSVDYTSTTEWSAHGLRITGASGIGPIVSRGDAGPNHDPIESPNTLTTVEDESLVIVFQSFDGADSTFTVTGTGWPTTPDAASSDGSGTGFESSCMYVSREMATAGLVPQLTVGTNGDGASYISFAVEPGGAPPPAGNTLKLGTVTVTRVYLGSNEVNPLYLNGQEWTP